MLDDFLGAVLKLTWGDTMISLLYAIWATTSAHARSEAFLNSLDLSGRIPFSNVSTKRSSKSTYDELFPLSIKTCAVSPYRDIYHKQVNDLNYWGHAVMFLKGVCRDSSSPLPKIRLCESTSDLSDPNSGTLISVVRAFGDTAWIAIEGGGLAFHGDLDPSDPIDENVCHKTARKVADSEIFKNIQLSDIGEKFRARQEFSQEMFIAKASLGTDYAIDFSRTSYCHVFPVTLNQMKDAVQFLNNLNEPFVTGKDSYQWKLYDNNCQHTVHNTLAAIGLKDPIPIEDHFIPIGIFKVHPPGGAFLDYAKETLHSLEHYSVREAFLTPLIRRSFETYGRPPISHGSKVEVIPMHTENNQLYVSVPRLFASPLSPKDHKFSKYLADPRLRDLRANLEMFQTGYLHLKDSLQPLEVLLDQYEDLRSPEFRSFYSIYTHWLEGALEEVESLLQRLATASESSAQSHSLDSL